MLISPATEKGTEISNEHSYVEELANCLGHSLVREMLLSVQDIGDGNQQVWFRRRILHSNLGGDFAMRFSGNWQAWTVDKCVDTLVLAENEEKVRKTVFMNGFQFFEQGRGGWRVRSNACSAQQTK